MYLQNLIVVEYSVKQKACHKHTLAEMLKTNVDNISRNKSTDYIPIGVFNNHEDADIFIKAVHDAQEKAEDLFLQDEAVKLASKIING